MDVSDYNDYFILIGRSGLLYLIILGDISFTNLFISVASVSVFLWCIETELSFTVSPQNLTSYHCNWCLKIFMQFIMLLFHEWL